MKTLVMRAIVLCVPIILLSGCSGDGRYPITNIIAESDDPVLQMQAHHFQVPVFIY
ncbi:hypothetical protein [Parasedimentitalea denitrificans]|uniref:hypothetical protein n=1 Tax=Parasedimentitalea denitrificans TaxID=2211118 RepID=UPI0014313EE3|nr:hypothetical protein [Sedimentitalea sp. CY04]